MARKRMMSPNFFISATMNALPMQTMLTFAGFWCFADDFGRAEDDESLVRASVWPRRKCMTDKKVRADLDALVDAGPLCQYTVCSVHLIHATSWEEHQTIGHPTPSKLPPCEKHEPEAWEAFLISTDPALHKFRSFS
jgi:hypothetical protein